MKHTGMLMAFGAVAMLLFVMVGTTKADSTSGSVTTDTTIVTTTSSRPPRSP